MQVNYRINSSKAVVGVDRPMKVLSILNKSENATPELFAIYIQTYANQECNGKCILMIKYWVMHNSKSFTDVVTRKHMKAI